MIDMIDTEFLPQKDLLRYEEVEIYFGVSRRTIDLWVENKLLVAEKKRGLKWITRASILDFRLKNRYKE